MNEKIKKRRERDKKRRQKASSIMLKALVDTNKSIKSIVFSGGFKDETIFKLMNARYIQNHKAIEKAIGVKIEDISGINC